MKTADKKRVPKQILKLRSQWRFLFRFWWSIHYISGALSIVAVAILGTRYQIQIPHFNTVLSSAVISIIAAGSMSIVILLGPMQKAERYYSAFHYIDQAILESLLNRISIGKLVDKTVIARDITLTGIKPLAANPKASDHDFLSETDQKVYQFEVPPAPR